MRTILTASLILLQLAASAQSKANFTPAGSINSTFKYKKIVFIVQDDPAVVRHATAVRNHLFKAAKILTGDEAVKADLSGHNVIAYGTIKGNAWLTKHEKRLPFKLRGKKVHIDKDYTGDNLRVICTLRNPQDSDRQVLVYTASRVEGMVEINNIFHGPTHWVVADGERILGSGDFHSSVPLTKETMLTDLEFLRAKIAAVHPATVDGLPKEVRMAFETARSSITTKTSRSDFWLIANRALVSLRDAHSSLSPIRTGTRIDLPVQWLEGGLIVERNTRTLRAGDRIVSIGGKTDIDLLAGLRHILPAENDFWVKEMGERSLSDVSILQALGAAKADKAVALVVDRNGRKMKLSAKPGDIRSHRSVRKRWARYRIEKDKSLGVFVLDSCKNDEFYRRTVKEFFDAVHRAKLSNIAVDLRANSGGNSTVVNEFLRYIDIPSYKSYSGEVRTSVESKSKRGQRGPVGYKRYGPNTEQNARHDDPPPFGGKLFLITSANTFSSGNWFAVVVQDNQLGQIIGEPTGNAPSSYGDIIGFKLPASAFEFHLSFKKWVRPDPSRDPAPFLSPDIYVPRKREHLMSGEDPVIAHLRKLIEK